MLKGIGKPYVESLFRQSDLPLDPLMSQTGVTEIADSVLLPFISFIIAFTALECIETYRKAYIEGLT